MYRIVKKEALKPTVILYEIEAPMVAKKAQPGQFIILRVDENGERIPITIHDYDREKGTVTIIVQTVGATTEKLSHKQQGLSLIHILPDHSGGGVSGGRVHQPPAGVLSLRFEPSGGLFPVGGGLQRLSGFLLPVRHVAVLRLSLIHI